MLLSEAVTRLQAGMFGGAVRRSTLVARLKEQQPRLSVGSGLQRQTAAAAIHVAIMAGDLVIHVVAQPTAEGACRSMAVPIDVLKRLPRARGGLPDHLVRHPSNLLRGCSLAPDLFAALSTSALHLRQSEFDAWYRRQKRRRKWPSQVNSVKPRIGRPSKQTDQLLTSIKARVAEQKWSASDGIAKLTTLLGLDPKQSRNTLRRAVDRLFVETGDPQFRIIPRKRTKARHHNPEV